MNFRSPLLLSVLLLLFSCGKDDSVNESPQDVSFNVNTILNDAGRTSGVNLEDATSILITIEKADGSSTDYSLEKLELFQVNSQFISEKISLLAGDYNLTEFFVLDAANNITHIAPLEGSEQAQNVENPLPITFSVVADQIASVDVEVLSSEDLSLEDFGFVGFNLSEIELFNFLVTVSEQGNLNLLLDGEIVISSADYQYTKQLSAIANNSIVIKDGYSSYQLSVQKDGYEPFEYTYSRDSLAHYESTPLHVELVVESNTGSPRPGRFMYSGQEIGTSSSNNVALGDLDGDGDLDALLSNSNEGNEVWLNDGSGFFTNTGQSLGDPQGFKSALGDLDGDGDLDAFMPRIFGSEIWLNDGTGSFTDTEQVLGEKTLAAELADLDGDGDLDAFTANAAEDDSGAGNKVWLNDGNGFFTDSGQSLGNSNSAVVSLGDLDGDGDIDAYVVNYGSDDKVWLNDGTGTFTENGQSLSSSNGYSVSLGDLDMDGDLDALVINNPEPDEVWFNDGNGIFTLSNLTLDGQFSQDAALGDVDGDGDLDIFRTNFFDNQVWLNNGSGVFTITDQTLEASVSIGISLGDLNGDGFLDAFVGQANAKPNQVWFNIE